MSTLKAPKMMQMVLKTVFIGLKTLEQLYVSGVLCQLVYFLQLWLGFTGANGVQGLNSKKRDIASTMTTMMMLLRTTISWRGSDLNSIPTNPFVFVYECSRCMLPVASFQI
jgi:hypothetical protein